MTLAIEVKQIHKRFDALLLQAALILKSMLANFFACLGLKGGKIALINILPQPRMLAACLLMVSWLALQMLKTGYKIQMIRQ